MILTRRRKIVLALFAIVSAAVLVLLFVPFGLSLADAERVNDGMRLSEVESMFGPSHYSGQLPNRKRATGFNEVWDVSDGFIQVVLDGKGPVPDQRVVKVRSEQMPKWKKFLERIRGCSNHL